MEGAEVGKGQETKEGARWKGAMSRARKDRFIVQRAAASGTGGAGAGRVVGGLGVVLGTGTGIGIGRARSLSLWPPSRRMSARACVKELADANGNANENANGNANGYGTSTIIGGVGCGCGRGRARRTRAWDLGTWGLGTCDLRLGAFGGPGRGRAPRLNPARLDFFGFLSPPPGPGASSRARAPGQGTADTPQKYNRDTCRSRWQRGTLPSTAPDHISQMTAPPSQQHLLGPARLSRLVLPRRCWCNCCTQGAVLYCSCRIVLLLGLDRLQ